MKTTKQKYGAPALAIVMSPLYLLGFTIKLIYTQIKIGAEMHDILYDDFCDWMKK